MLRPLVFWRYLFVCTSFIFFISIELVTKRNRCICVSVRLMFHLIDRESLMMFISRWTIVIPDKKYIHYK